MREARCVSCGWGHRVLPEKKGRERMGSRTRSRPQRPAMPILPIPSPHEVALVRETREASLVGESLSDSSGTELTDRVCSMCDSKPKVPRGLRHGGK